MGTLGQSSLLHLLRLSISGFRSDADHVLHLYASAPFAEKWEAGERCESFLSKAGTPGTATAGSRELWEGVDSPGNS